MSITADAWSADTTKMGFLGMTAHWIEVKGKEWKMRSEVIGFKSLSGAHTGENLGRYAVGLLDRVGIMDEKRSKVRHVLTCQCVIIVILTPIFYYKLYTATLDNTSNNDTTCETIEKIHNIRGFPTWSRREQQLP